MNAKRFDKYYNFLRNMPPKLFTKYISNILKPKIEI